MSAYIGVFDMLKIGVGPSSSHTLGPWRAVEKFLTLLSENNQLFQVKKIKAELYGSLSLTGRGHATDSAIILALLGEKPEQIVVEHIPEILEKVKKEKKIKLNQQFDLPFDPEQNIIFHSTFLPFHSNALKLSAYFETQATCEEIYYSIGGGFIIQEHDQITENLIDKPKMIPFLIHSGKDLEFWLKQHPNYKISDLALENEKTFISETEIRSKLLEIWWVMSDSIFLGASTEGILPGGLQVKRRAAALSEQLLKIKIRNKTEFFETLKNLKNISFSETLDFISLFALAVNEVNANLGRVVTAPTNGSAGVVPAVLCYFLHFLTEEKDSGRLDDLIVNYLLNAGLIGSIFKKGATISAAAGGCQAEIGVSSAMAASALTEIRGGSPEQAIVAAEIAMEHHLGMTCDPIGGLVQIPCIERNTMGAIKAITASNLALKTTPSETKIPLDAVINAMWETAQDMDIKYKETSMGGLAKQISVNEPAC